MTTRCQAHKAEKIIRETGMLKDGHFVVGRPIDISGATVSGNWFTLTPAAQAVADKKQIREAKARNAREDAREAECHRLRDLGVAMIEDIEHDE
jgi:hypothetical protein